MKHSNEGSGLFKHHKGNLYFAHGIAKHSETLEEFVVYETKYENPLGKLWIRPRKMFEGTVQKNGATVPRFAPLTWKIIEKSAPTPDDFNDIMEISENVFGKCDPEKLKSELESSTRWLFLFAKDTNNKTIGFKYGKAQNNKEFFSTNGGVLPDFRNLGVASVLMKAQHEWAKNNGFVKIYTSTRNHFPGMLRLNLNFGFQIVGCTTEGGMPKIHMTKEL